MAGDTLTILDPLISSKNAEIEVLNDEIEAAQGVVSDKQDALKVKLTDLYALQKRAFKIMGMDNTGIRYDVKDPSIKENVKT